MTERVLACVRGFEGTGGTLVILGDLFDMWAGRPQQEETCERRVLDALRRLAASGVRLAFLGGNRDFAFDGADGLEIDLWPDAVRTRWGDRTVLLTHGDLLCTADRGYLRMRRLLRGGRFSWLTRLASYRMRRYLGRGLRRYSERTTKRSRGARLGIDYGAAAAWMESLGADLLVAGHVHTGVHHRRDGPRPLDILVLKDWDRTGSVVLWDGSRPLLASP
jgi:UDP-2,3-diacylglucosamine hydrolase